MEAGASAYHGLDASVLVVLHHVAVDIVVDAVGVAVNLVPAEAHAGAKVILDRVVADDVAAAASIET